MPTRRQHINNINAFKLIDDLALLKECSISIAISVEALSEAENDMHTGWNHTRFPRLPYSSSSPPFSPTSAPYCTTSPPHIPLQTPPESPLESMLRSPLESNDKSQGNCKKSKLISSNAKPLKLIAGKQRTL